MSFRLQSKENLFETATVNLVYYLHEKNILNEYENILFYHFWGHH